MACLMTLNSVCPEFCLLPHHNHIVDMIVNEKLPFNCSLLITKNDLQGLIGESASPESKWLSNFTIDEHLKILSRQDGNLNVEVFTWEEFERSVGNKPVKDIVQSKASLLNQDLILVPCNPLHSQHWFLLAVQPKQRRIVILDSLAGDCDKPSWHMSVEKMMGLLKELNGFFNIQDWTIHANKANEIPQQGNSYDCGVYVCLFARTLVLNSPIVNPDCIPQFRKLMVLELYDQQIQPIPPKSVCPGDYYAVDYITNFYIGRVVQVHGELVKFKFLHPVGAYLFDWPRRDDIDSCHMSCIFYGPVQLDGNGPFKVSKQPDIEKVFKS